MKLSSRNLGPNFVTARASLDGDDCDEHVERDGGEAVLLQEGHEEAEPDEDHHVHVLEHWGGRDEGEITLEALHI